MELVWYLKYVGSFFGHVLVKMQLVIVRYDNVEALIPQTFDQCENLKCVANIMAKMFPNIRLWSKFGKHVSKKIFCFCPRNTGYIHQIKEYIHQIHTPTPVFLALSPEFLAPTPVSEFLRYEFEFLRGIHELTRYDFEFLRGIHEFLRYLRLLY